MLYLIKRHIFTDSLGTIKIGHLGQAKKINSSKTSHRTLGIGTLPYMSPEMIKEENYDKSTDIW